VAKKEEITMRAPRLCVLGLLAGSLAVVPAVSHAAGYKHFTSKSSCPYSIDYPTSWKVGTGPVSNTFSNEVSATKFVGVVVACGKTSARASASTVTKSEMKSFRSQGYVLSAPRMTNGVGIFTGRKTTKARGKTLITLIEVASTVHGSRSWALVYAADYGSFKQSLPLYVHMLGTFNGK
jgi:hypothetical protein